MTKQIALFLFAHQDDEFGVYYEIEEMIAKNKCVLCMYLTNGGYGNASIEDRNQDSTDVLVKLGVRKENIHFIGSRLSIEDSKLCFSLWTAILEVDQLLKKNSIDTLYCPAWEGGHPDHDALYIIAMILIKLRRLERGNQWQYFLYNSEKLPYTFFRVLRPLKLTEKIFSRKIPIKKRLIYLSYCASYRSQIKTWIGLFPFVALHYIFDGNQYLLPIKLFNFILRPHKGALYYEKRAFITWGQFKTAINSQQKYYICM
jgi:LmbE family N-acetylglucosaminyl deacetylase